MGIAEQAGVIWAVRGRLGSSRYRSFWGSVPNHEMCVQKSIRKTIVCHNSLPFEPREAFWREKLLEEKM